MRNIFDQYDQPENRLSHALAVCLNEDRALLRGFLFWAGERSAPSSDLRVVEQALPGETQAPVAEREAESRGLPDIVIHDGQNWCLLVESKIEAGLTEDQLVRHQRTLRRRGFERITSVALTKAGVEPPAGVVGRSWCSLYEWLSTAGRGREWPERLRDYLRVAEVRLARDGYLTEGTLTMFDGFPFSLGNPYTYGEAKRLLRLAVSDLRKDASLRAVGMDPDSPGRDRIPGEGGTYIWDFLSLRGRPAGKGHTRFPHLTLAIHTDHLEIAVSIPDKIPPELRRGLAGLGESRMRELHREIVNRATPLLGDDGWVEVFALQRHYRSQSSPPIVDARMSFKLETSLADAAGRVKHQPEWMELFLSLLHAKKSNIHFAYAVHLPWSTPGLATRDALGVVAAGWTALFPVLKAMGISVGSPARTESTRA